MTDPTTPGPVPPETVGAAPDARLRWRWWYLGFAAVAALGIIVFLVTRPVDGDGSVEGGRPPDRDSADGPGTTATQPARTTSVTTASTTTALPSTTTARPSSTTTSTLPATTAPAPTSIPIPPSSSPAVAVWKGPSTRRTVALTFDAGSDTGRASQILDTLAVDGIRATFGMTGRWAESNPGLVRRMVAEGHQLVNHTYDHPSFTGVSAGDGPLPRAQRLEQLRRAESIVEGIAGVSMAPWFRPPYGDEDATVRADVGAAGYRYELMWTVDSLGWKGVPAAEVVTRCLVGAQPGAIYLFHVGAASTDAAALQRIIDGLRAGGYRFATASDLLGS